MIMTREEIVDLLEILAANYPNTKITDAENMVNTWELAFAEDPAEDIYKAARHHINYKKFFPTPAEIREEVVKARLLYDQESDVPMIEAPATSYIEDNSRFDDLVESIPAYNEICRKCSKYSECIKHKV